MGSRLTNPLRLVRRSALLALEAAVLLAGPAAAATPIQIGQISPTVFPESCDVGNVPQLATGPAPSYAVPSDGVITEWSHRGSPATPGSGGLQVWRSAGDSGYALVGKSEIKNFAAGVNSYPISLPVKAGDLLGLRVASSGTECFFIGHEGDVAGGGDSSDPALGETRTFSPMDYLRANVSATFDGPPNTTISSGPAGITNEDGPSFGFTSDEPDSSFECRLDAAAFSACSPPRAYSKLPDGDHTFRVRATDPEGNTDPSPATRRFTVDTEVDASVKAKKKQKHMGKRIRIKIKVKANENVTAKATGKIKVRKKSYEFEGQTEEVDAGESEQLKLKASKKDSKKIIKAVKNGKKATATVKVRVGDDFSHRAFFLKFGIGGSGANLFA